MTFSTHDRVLSAMGVISASIVLLCQAHGYNRLPEVPMSRFLADCFVIIVLSTMVHGADDAKSTVAKLNEAWLSA
jgi:hypothetical protein